ncbi:MAG: serine/threonine-protein kinase [Isosphaeraceae bacterium]
MTVSTRCPNRSCGCVSQLVDDPLGRIFRCPRCLTKLPTAPAAAADSGWTAVMRPTLRAGSSAWDGDLRTNRADARARRNLAGVATIGRDGHPLGFESGEMAIGVAYREFDDESAYGPGSDPGLGFDESGEMIAEPFSRSGSLVSAWSSPSRSRASVASGSGSAPSAAAAIGSDEGGQFGRFRVLGVLGQGQHATVYRACDTILDRDVALKVPRRGVLRTAKSLERFLGEARAQARLRHPRIVPVYEAGRAGEQHYIAMALIEGCSLAERLDDGPLPLRRSVEVVVELAEALAYAHAQGVVHRDVKPANVRVDTRGDVYLMDFGIAYRPDSDEVPLPPGNILGTPAYVAPEQAKGGQSNVLPASDQYSLGAVFFELLCGRTPFCGPPSYVLFHTIHHDPPSPRSIAPKVPRALEAICLKALAKRPERRYADCQHFADDLRRWLRGETPLACRRAWARIGR